MARDGLSNPDVNGGGKLTPFRRLKIDPLGVHSSAYAPEGGSQNMDVRDVGSESVFRSETPRAQLFDLNGVPQGAAVLVVKRGPNAGSRFLLHQATMTAGRHPNSDIFLDDIIVSRQHAQFRCVRGEFKVVDVDSLNDTYVNGEAVSSAVLANGDEVQIGKFRLVFLTGPTTGRH